MRKILIIGLVAALAGGCVSMRKYDSMRAEALRYESELEVSRERLAVMTESKNGLQNDCKKLCADTARLGAECRQLNANYKKLLADGSAEAARMLRQLEMSQQELAARSQRVDELEQMLRAREEAMQEIRRKVADALLGFEGKGLTITTRDGKVYVSMEDKLLFRSGSFEIDPKGAEAVKELATVLAANPDINIMVEGHTDNVPYRPNGQLKDNLDLSAKRATTVVRLLLQNKSIDPVRIIAAGRGESLPIDTADTPEARQKNRRTEIILTPKLDELLQIMK